MNATRIKWTVAVTLLAVAVLLVVDRARRRDVLPADERARAAAFGHVAAEEVAKLVGPGAAVTVLLPDVELAAQQTYGRSEWAAFESAAAAAGLRLTVVRAPRDWPESAYFDLFSSHPEAHAIVSYTVPSADHPGWQRLPRRGPKRVLLSATEASVRPYLKDRRIDLAFVAVPPQPVPDWGTRAPCFARTGKS